VSLYYKTAAICTADQHNHRTLWSDTAIPPFIRPAVYHLTDGLLLCVSISCGAVREKLKGFSFLAFSYNTSLFLKSNYKRAYFLKLVMVNLNNPHVIYSAVYGVIPRVSPKKPL